MGITAVFGFYDCQRWDISQYTPNIHPIYFAPEQAKKLPPIFPHNIISIQELVADSLRLAPGKEARWTQCFGNRTIFVYFFQNLTKSCENERFNSCFSQLL